MAGERKPLKLVELKALQAMGGRVTTDLAALQRQFGPAVYGLIQDVMRRGLCAQFWGRAFLTDSGKNAVIRAKVNGKLQASADTRAND